MSERMCACITIGGRLRRANAPVLLSAIAESHVGLEWGESGFAPTDTDDLLGALKDGRLWLGDDQAPYGAMPRLEEACRTLWLPFRRHAEGKYEFDAEVIDWRPGMAEPLVRTGSNEDPDAIYVRSDRIREALEFLETGCVPNTLAILRELCPQVEPVPPFQIV